MIAQPSVQPPITQPEPGLTQDQLDTLRTTCSAIAARGGEMGDIAECILGLSNTLQALTDEADAFLARHRA